MSTENQERNSIDWEHLARQLGALTAKGESSSSDVAMRAVELLLGKARLRATVDYYVGSRPGRELARSVLWHLHPWSAMERCYEIYRSDADVEARTSAVELLRVVADRRALAWAGEFLADPEPAIQNWGAGLVDQLLWSGLIWPDDCAVLLQTMREHPNLQVRSSAAFIDGYLRDREQSREGEGGTSHPSTSA